MAALLILAAPAAGRAGEAPPANLIEACLHCHGPAGLAGNPAVPDLGGQRLQYLEKQIADFRRQSAERLLHPIAGANLTGLRDHPDMDAYTGLIDTRETAALLTDLTARSCRQAPSPPGVSASRPMAKPPLAARCTACHGARGAQTVNGFVPRIAGQSRTYLAAQMFAMRRAEHGGEGSTALTLRSHPIMNAVAVGLSTDEIRTLADYLSTLPCK